MTQKQQLLQMFKDNDNLLSLGQILATNLAAEYRARMSDLRREGHEITCTINAKVPSENIYMLVTNSKAPLRQESWPCPICGSYCRRGSECNICIRKEAI